MKMKKILTILMTFFMVLCTFCGCSDKVDQEEYRELLTYYKTVMAQQLDVYGMERSEKCDDKNRLLISEAVEKGKLEIEQATNKATVDCAVVEAKQSIDEVPTKAKEPENLESILKRKLIDMDDISGITLTSWADNPRFPGMETWYQQIEVSLSFPRVVKQGEEFEVKVITANISDRDVVFKTSSSLRDRGVPIGIALQGDDEFNYVLYVQGGDGMINCDLVTNTIPVGEKLEKIWKFDGIMGSIVDNNDTVAPKGVYDVYVLNGDVYHNAIEIV